MTWHLEQPLPIIAMGALLFAMLLGGLIKTGRRGLLGAMIAVVFATIGMLMLERIVVTPGEQIAATLQQLARDIQTNEPSLVFQHISATAEPLRNDAEMALERIEIHKVTVKSNLETEISANGEKATARFNASFDASAKSGLVNNQHAAWFFVVDFVKQQGRWLVTDYKRYDPLHRDSELAAHEM